MIYSKAITLAENHPLDFTLQYPPRREYFQSCFKGEADIGVLLDKPEMLLYLHVPFCAAKCYFCNFAVDVRSAPDLHKKYVDLLCEQVKRIDDRLPDGTTVPGIDIGGGTPTLLNEKLLAQILKTLEPWKRRINKEHYLSIETTPSIAACHPERLDALVAGGVTRISMGVQSMNAKTLESVNRKQQENMVEKAITNMRKAGFHRINVDVIFALPGQTVDDWSSCIDQAVDLDIDSITTYDCLYRGKGRALTKRTADKPSPDIYGALYDLSYQKLSEAGFHAHYGSVNFSRHLGETGTSPYFEERLFDHTPYVGAGNYASSMVGNHWWFAPYGVNAWMKQIEDKQVLPFGDFYSLPDDELMAKQVLLSLNFGVIDAHKFKARFGRSIESIYGDALDYGLLKGWFERTENGYGVAQGHFKNMHLIRALFYSSSATEWLLELNEKELRS